MIHRVIIIVFRALILYRLRRFINHLLTYLLSTNTHMEQWAVLPRNYQ